MKPGFCLDRQFSIGLNRTYLEVNINSWIHWILYYYHHDQASFLFDLIFGVKGGKEFSQQHIPILSTNIYFFSPAPRIKGSRLGPKYREYEREKPESEKDIGMRFQPEN